MRFMNTGSFHAGRTTQAAGPLFAACSRGSSPAISTGECSESKSIQYNPDFPNISATMGLQKVLQMPSCRRPSRSAVLNELCGNGMASHELHGDTAERPEIGMQVVAFLRPQGRGKRARQHHVTRLQGDIEGRELIRQPGDCQRRVAE